MATVFDSLFGKTGFSLLLTQFGEPITYMPNGGESRTVKAIVERDPPAIFDAVGNAVLPAATIRIRSCKNSGVPAKDVDTGKDQFEFVLKIGETVPKRYSVMQLISQDSGVTQLALR